MEIKLINTQKVLSRTQINIADYVINSWRGCEFNCVYCYARQNKNAGEFSSCLGVKINAQACLERELKYKTPSRVLLGSTTECFPYQELKYKITGQILEILNKNNIPYTILTKSHLIKEYLPLISKNPKNKIYFTVNFADDKTIRLFEEKSPFLNQRLETISEIIKNNILLRIHLGPYVAGLSYFKKILKILPPSVKEIDIELYHRKMGNFEQVIAKINSKKIKTNLQKIYANKENYDNFSLNLKKEVEQFCRKYYPRLKVFYIIPDYNEFYNSSIDYEPAQNVHKMSVAQNGK